MNIGIDFHDTFTYYPDFFISIINVYPGKKFIVTGTPEQDRKLVELELKKYDIFDKIDGLLMGFNFSKDYMNVSHFDKMAQHKLKLLQENNISIYFDDNPFYASYLKDFNICVFQTIVSQDYMSKYKNKDSYFSAHLQESQFLFLKNLKK